MAEENKKIYQETGTNGANGKPLYYVYDSDGTVYSTTDIPEGTIAASGDNESDLSKSTVDELETNYNDLQSKYDTLESEFQQQGELNDEQKQQLSDIKGAQLSVLNELGNRKTKSEECEKAIETNTSWYKEQKCDAYFNSTEIESLRSSILEKIYDMPDPCGKSTLSTINNTLLNFFKTLKEIKKYYNVYVQGSISKIQNISSIISNAADIIGSVLKLLVQRIRNYILNLLRKLIEKVIDKILTPLTKDLKNGVIKQIVEQLLCKFNEIIKGIRNLVVDFLYAMIGNVINAPFCAVEQFTNALINNLSAQIDKAIGPILDGINDVLGGVARIAGSVFQAIDFILGFEAFLCAKPKCPEIKSWIPGGGPVNSMKENFDKAIPIPNAYQAEQYVLEQAGQFIDNFLPDVGIFGDEKIDAADLTQATPPPGVSCFPGAFRCGPPTVEFFGGGGAGAVGNAVVNSIGEVVGVDLIYGGEGYTAPPFVTFADSCRNGGGASAYTVTDNIGRVVKVIMVNSGNRYLNNVSGRTEFNDAIENLVEDVETVTRSYVTCLDEIQIINTGIGYKPTDELSITPNVTGLEVKIQITEAGQIVGMDILSSGCGFAEIPDITINSDTGVGLEVRPIMRFIERENFTETPLPDKLIQVIDCVTK